MNLCDISQKKSPDHLSTRVRRCMTEIAQQTIESVQQAVESAIGQRVEEVKVARLYGLLGGAELFTRGD